MPLRPRRAHASHSPSFDQRRNTREPRTAIASAFFCPTSTTSFRRGIREDDLVEFLGAVEHLPAVVLDGDVAEVLFDRAHEEARATRRKA